MQLDFVVGRRSPGGATPWVDRAGCSAPRVVDSSWRWIREFRGDDEGRALTGGVPSSETSWGGAGWNRMAQRVVAELRW